MTTKPIRIRGFKYAPRLVYDIDMSKRVYQRVYRVRQKGFWMGSSVEGPAKPTEYEAIKAWNRLARTIWSWFTAGACASPPKN